MIAVSGNDLVVKLPEGTRELRVPDDFRFTVDGKQLAARELKPGMKGSATITTRTTVTPVVVTEVKNGEVVQASGATLLVKTEQGFKQFSQGDVEKRGIKMVKDGAPAQFTDFRAGDRLSATIVTTLPPKVMTEREVNATLAKAAPASAGTRSVAYDVEPGGGSRRGARRGARAKEAAEDGKRLAAARAGQHPVDRDGPDADRSPALRPLGRSTPSRAAPARRTRERDPAPQRHHDLEHPIRRARSDISCPDGCQITARAMRRGAHVPTFSI